MNEDRIPCNSADEMDALSRRWKNYLKWKPGERKAIKRLHNRKKRRVAKDEIRGSLSDF